MVVVTSVVGTVVGNVVPCFFVVVYFFEVVVLPRFCSLAICFSSVLICLLTAAKFDLAAV